MEVDIGGQRTKDKGQRTKEGKVYGISTFNSCSREWVVSRGDSLFCGFNITYIQGNWIYLTSNSINVGLDTKVG